MRPRQIAGIYGLTAARNRLEIEFVPGNLHQHKTLVCIKTFYPLAGFAKIMRHQLAGITQNKVVDIIFRLDSLINVLMA